MKLPVKILREGIGLPTRAYEGDAGVDLAAAEDAVLGPHERRTIKIGIAVEIPEGHVGLILPRSGKAARYGITHLDAPGVIDSGYRGEIHFILYNSDKDTPFEVKVGDRLGQLVVLPVADLEPTSVEEMSMTARGASGLGSSDDAGTA